jgi:predicted glycogen debranching enzyme
MDAKVDGTVITPRHGKPVEIQALWIAGNRRAAAWLERRGDHAGSARATERAVRAREAFCARYWDAPRGWLRDVVDGPQGDDPTLRPNQLLALAVTPDLVTVGQARAILDACERHLVVPGGVRTLAPFEPGYRPAFQGPPAFRDSAYHQGPAWTWLLGAWLDAVERWRGEEAAGTELRRHLEALDPDRTGAIPELLEPEPPHAGRGCPFQAWGTAELLRVATRLRAGAH